MYSKLKYESGVHRVQRVPQTEAQGRVHTSTATVAIMPEVDFRGLQYVIVYGQIFCSRRCSLITSGKSCFQKYSCYFSSSLICLKFFCK